MGNCDENKSDENKNDENEGAVQRRDARRINEAVALLDREDARNAAVPGSKVGRAGMGHESMEPEPPEHEPPENSD